LLKSKIHNARVSDANLDYKGSLPVDPILMEQADMLPYKKLDIANISNGQRFSTYAITGQVGDLIIFLTYTIPQEDEISSHIPVIPHVDEDN
jgi:aspartate 1-decarboxylase